MKLIEHLRAHAELQGTKDALVSDAGALNYGDLLELVEERASGLRKLGVKPGSTVAISIAGEIEHFITCLALLALGTRQVVLAGFDTHAVREDLTRRAAAPPS